MGTMIVYATLNHRDSQCDYRGYSAYAEYTYDMYSKIEEYGLND